MDISSDFQTSSSHGSVLDVFTLPVFVFCYLVWRSLIASTYVYSSSKLPTWFDKAKNATGRCGRPGTDLSIWHLGHIHAYCENRRVDGAISGYTTWIFEGGSKRRYRVHDLRKHKAILIGCIRTRWFERNEESFGRWMEKQKLSSQIGIEGIIFNWWSWWRVMMGSEGF